MNGFSFFWNDGRLPVFVPLPPVIPASPNASRTVYSSEDDQNMATVQFMKAPSGLSTMSYHVVRKRTIIATPRGRL